MLFASCLGVFLAGLLLLLVFIGAIGALVTAFSESVSSPKVETKKVTAHSVLLLDLKGLIGDSESPTAVLDVLMSESGEKRNFTLRQVTDAIDVAAEDAHVEAIALQLENSAMGYATAQEIRQHLEKFKTTGKPIYAYADSYSYGNYYLSSLADSIYMNPVGVLGINGIGRQTLFMTGVLKKLGVEMEIFKVGTFKGAVEPYLLKELSEPNRRQLNEIMQGLWDSTAEEIALSRNIRIDSLQSFADRGYFIEQGDVAKSLGYIDSLMYQPDFKGLLAQKLTGDIQGKIHLIRVNDLLTKKDKTKGDKIALVVADGSIRDVDPAALPIPFAPGMEGPVISSRLIRELRKVADDEDIKAVVMKVNSPGGDAFLSDKIYYEVARLKAKKPIVVSMGDYAASGGYYISAPASKIIAHPTTLTGSIGIFGMIPNLAGTAQKIDLTEETVKTARYADLGNLFRPMTEDEKAIIQRSVSRGYDLFLSRVAEGRGLSTAEVDSIGQGRVWLGKKALELGLVDKLGGLDEAFREAARLAELDHYSIYISKPEKSILEQILEMSSGEVRSKVNMLTLTPEQRQFMKLADELKGMTGIQARPLISIEDIRLESQPTPYR